MIISFTGHRPKDLYGYDNEKPYKEIVETIKKNMIALDDELTVITGGAQGIDQLAFWAAEHMKREGHSVKTVVAVPFKGQERLWRKAGHFGRDEYALMLKLADKVIYLSGNANDAVRKLDERNHWMVDNSDLLCCVTPYADIEHRKGGTGNCVRYAIRTDHPYLVWMI